MTSKTYDQMHHGLHWARGKAGENACVGGCGKQAKDWAFLHVKDGLVDDQGRKYSESFEDYAPMCSSCHHKFDHKMDPERHAQTEHLNRGRAILHQRMRDRDPELIELFRENGRRLVGQILTGEVRRRAGYTTGNIKRKCSCGRIMGAGPLGMHQKHSGHEGWTPE